MVRIFTVEEVERLKHYTRMEPCGLMVRLIVNMGLRHAEVLDLRVGDYDFAANRLRISGPNARVPFVPEKMRFPLVRLIHGRDENGFIISTCPAGRRQLGARTFQAYLNRVAEQLELDRLTVNNLRATCIVRFLEAGMDPRLIQKQMGIRARKSITKYRGMLRKSILVGLPAVEPDFDLDRQVVAL